MRLGIFPFAQTVPAPAASKKNGGVEQHSAARRPAHVAKQTAKSKEGATTIPLVPRAVAHLPSQRWHWSARRRLAQDHPFGRIGRMEAGLEELVSELEFEVDRLIESSQRLLDSEQPS